MQSCEHFLHIFFSSQFGQFLKLKEISKYRQICKRARDTKIHRYLSSSQYTHYQLDKVIPLYTDVYEVLKNTFFYRKEEQLNRYRDLFISVCVEDCRTGDIGYLCVENYDEISGEEEKSLLNKGHTHYIYIYFEDPELYCKKNKYILSFSSQQSVLSFATYVIDEMKKQNRYHCDSCLCETFIDIVKTKNCIHYEEVTNM